MSTWYGYVCLSHEPPLEQDRIFHGHKGCEFLIWNLRRRRGQVQETTNYHDQNGTANAWLDEHEDCNVGVRDGYGEVVYTYLKDTPKPEIELPPITQATELKRGAQYLLSTDKAVTAEQADRIRAVLHERFPTNTFVLGNGITVVDAVEAKPLAQGGLVTKGRPFLKEAREQFIPYGENGPEPMVPAQIQEMRRMRLPQPHAVRQNDLVAAVKRAEAACERQWELAGLEEKVAWAGAMLGMHELVVALLNPQSGDGAATPPAEPSTTRPVPAGAGTADESATGDHQVGAAPSPSELGLGAVVRTSDGEVFVRRIQNNNRDRVWWLVPDGTWYANNEIGPEVEVLAKGVFL